MRSLFLTLSLLLLFPILSFADQIPKMTDNASNTPKVKLETTAGDIIIQLDGDKAPITTANFLTYVKDGFYDGTIFHRIIPGFMAQGGGFSVGMKQKEVRSAIQNEANNGLKNDRGTIAMARTGDPHSATAQFFINFKDNEALNHTGENMRGWGYTVFGQVVEGMYLVDEMAHVPTGHSGPHGDVPKTDIVIKKASLITEPAK